MTQYEKIKRQKYRLYRRLTEHRDMCGKTMERFGDDESGSKGYWCSECHFARFDDDSTTKLFTTTTWVRKQQDNRNIQQEVMTGENKDSITRAPDTGGNAGIGGD